MVWSNNDNSATYAADATTIIPLYNAMLLPKVAAVESCSQ